MKPQLIDLFAGIGGFSYAGHQLGWETKLFCEIEEFPRKVLTKNFPGVPIHDDIKTLTYEKYKDIFSPSALTILTGGFPCQPFSSAGKRKGNDDDRALWPEMLRVIREFKPAYVIGENVAGILSMENESEFEEWVQIEMEGKTIAENEYHDFIWEKRQQYVLAEIIESLEQEGYAVQTFVIPACAVQAVHRRDRVWIVGKHISTNPNIGTNDKNRRGYEKKNCLQAISRKKVCAGNLEGAVNTDGEQIFSSQSIPYSIGNRLQGREKFRQLLEIWQTPKRLPSTHNERGNRQLRTKPTISRKHDGIPSRVDRYTRQRNKSLGNAIVPQVAFEIFKAIEKEF